MLMSPSLGQQRPDAHLPSLYEVRQRLDESQWWPAEKLRAWQFEQLQSLLKHAANTIPFYRRCMQEAGVDPRHAIDEEKWSRLPILTRSELQRLGAVMTSQRIPSAHKPTNSIQTSGSTGMPIKTLGTALTRLYWNAINLRDHAWHRRDLSGKLAAIRSSGRNKLPKEGLVLPNWGPPTAEVYKTGPAAALSVQTYIDEQADWLCKQDPDYLITYPSNLQALAEYFQRTGQNLTRLRELRTYGETVNPELRDVCQRTFGVPLVDMYSSQEVGYIALQCPDHEHYHVQSESVLVEILNQNNEPCRPGEVGQVVITTLHNYAMPLIRYAILDYAEPGPECSCGRSLPVLNRIMGRQRNMLILPNGKQTWPTFPSKSWEHIGSIQQMQLVQKSLEHIEVRYVAERLLSPAQEQELIDILCKRFKHPFVISFANQERIERSGNYKFEDFVSEVAI